MHLMVDKILTILIGFHQNKEKERFLNLSFLLVSFECYFRYKFRYKNKKTGVFWRCEMMIVCAM